MRGLRSDDYRMLVHDGDLLAPGVPGRSDHRAASVTRYDEARQITDDTNGVAQRVRVRTQPGHAGGEEDVTKRGAIADAMTRESRDDHGRHPDEARRTAFPLPAARRRQRRRGQNEGEARGRDATQVTQVLAA